MAGESDIVEYKCLGGRVAISHCRGCDAYRRHEKGRWPWIKAKSEEELAACCFKLVDYPIRGRRRVLSARFIPIKKPPSPRVILRMMVAPQKAYVADFVCLETMCDSCTGDVPPPHHWVASVQLRHRVAHTLVFSYLDFIFTKEDATLRAIQINQVDQGIDFFFGQQTHAVEFVEMITQFVPVKTHTTTTSSSSSRRKKCTFALEIPPFFLNDLICLPPNLVVGGNPGPILICTRMSNRIALLDPFTLSQCYLDAGQYWGAPFKPPLTREQLVEFIVLHVQITVPADSSKRGHFYALAEVRIVRLSDFGNNDKVFSVKTHLGNHLEPGDHALGYDLYGVKLDDFEHQGLVLPEAILIRESYESICRKWKLRV